MFMKKLLVIVLAVAVMGCAGANKSTYNPPEKHSIRAWSIILPVSQCYPPVQQYRVFIANTKELAAWCDTPNKIILSEGLLERYNDDTLKLIIAHEMAHLKLGHYGEIKTVRNVTTGVMMVLNTIIPGAGWFNYAVNPAVTNNFSKSKESEADLKATEICLNCLKMTREQILKSALTALSGEGGFWSTHPSAADRIINIEAYLNSQIKISPHSPAQTAPASPPPSGKASGKTPSP